MNVMNFKMMNSRIIYFILIFLTFLIPSISLMANGDGWSLPDFSDPLLVNLRIPRMLTAALVGAALAASGAALQALFRNPLADPALIGTSSGAALGVVCVIALGLGSFGLPIAAFVGALLTTLLLIVLAQLLNAGILGLLLMGLVLGAFVGAITSLLMFLSDDLTLRAAMSWLAGNVSGASEASLGFAAALIFAAVLGLILLGRDLDCLTLGEEQARGLGLSPHRTRVFVVCAAALATGAAVSISGIISFIGMMVPNALALIFGGTRRRLIMLSAWVGAIFLMMMDLIARTIAWPIDLPVGLLAAFTGPPFFLWLFWIRSRRGM